jgi:hypothetical protein
MVSGGKLSAAEVRHRQQICTTSAFAQLQASPEYKLWKRQQDARGPFSALKSLWQDTPQLIIASVMFLVVILLIGTSVSLRHQATHVHNASNAIGNTIAASTSDHPPPAQLPSPPVSQQQQQQQQHIELEPKESIISSSQLTNLVESLQSDLKTGRQAVAAAEARAANAEAQAAFLTSKTQQLQAALAKSSFTLSSQPPLPKTWSEVGELVLSFITSRHVRSERRFNNARAMMISPTMALSLLGLVTGIAACSIGIVISMIVRMKQTRYHQTEAKLIAAVPGQTRMELDRLKGQLATAKLELTAARRAIQQQQVQQVQVQQLLKAPVEKIVEKANNNSNNNNDAVREQWRQAAVSVWNAVVSSSSPESVSGAALLMSSNDTIPAVKATHSHSHHNDNNTNATTSPAAWMDAILYHFQTLSEALATTTAERSNAIDTAAAAQAECQRFQSAAAAFEIKIQQEGEKYDAIISNLQEKLHLTESDVISAKDALAASQQRCAVLDTQAQRVGAALEEADDQRRGLEERVVGLEQELSSLTALAEMLSSDKKALLSTDGSNNESNRDNMASVGTTNPTDTIMGQIMAARHISDRSTTTTSGATLADYFSRRLDSVASMLNGGGGGNSNSSSRERRVSADNGAVNNNDGGDDDGTWLERTNQLFESAESLLGAQLPSSLTHHEPPAAAPSSDDVAAVVVTPAAVPSSSSSMMLDQEERLLLALQTSSEQVGELLAALHTARQLDCRSSSDMNRNAALIRAENQLRVAHDKVAGAVTDLKSAGQGVVQSKVGVKQLAEVVAEKYRALEACQKVVEQANQAKIAAERDIDANNATLADIQAQLQNPFAEEAELKPLRDAALAALDVAVEAKRVAVADLTAAHQAVKNAEGEYVQAARELSQAETKATEVAAVKNGAAGGLQLAQKRLLTALEAANIALQVDL